MFAPDGRRTSKAQPALTDTTPVNGILVDRLYAPPACRTPGTCDNYYRQKVFFTDEDRTQFLALLDLEPARAALAKPFLLLCLGPSHFLTALAYVDLNPVRARMVGIGPRNISGRRRLLTAV